ncbi:MAG: hypothetical protein ACLP1X_13920 [Polyangiaceae bacterium]|jgi:hypothetical protein
MLVSNRRSILTLGAAGLFVLASSCGSKSGGGFQETNGSSGSGGYNPGAAGPGGGGLDGDDTDASTGGAASGGTSSGSGAASSSGATGSSGSGNGGTGTSSGATTSSSGAGSSASTSGGTVTIVDSGPACTATVSSGAVALTSNYLAGSVIGDGGYAYAYDDGMGSTACLDTTALCGTGTTAVTNASGSIWGAGIGFNLNQAVATGAASPAVNTYAATGTGLTYALSNLPPQGMRIVIDDGGTDYCVPIGAASGTVNWASFNTKCWDNSGTFLSGAPATATHILFQVTADAAATRFNLCVTSITFATSSAPPPDAGSGSGGDGTGGCQWSGGPTSGGDGELTCYWFGQGTSTGSGCSSYKTYCGYCGTESGGGGGTCPTGITDTVSNIATPYFAAFPVGTFGQGKYCGMCVDVSYQGRTITATVIDECATCTDSGGHIDLGLSAAVALGVGQGSSTGDPKNGVTWESVACPISGDVVAVYNGSSSQIYFENVAFPVASASAGGATATQQDGFWNFGTLVGGKSVTLTDTLGHTITGTIPTSSGGSIGAQFPTTCN